MTTYCCNGGTCERCLAWKAHESELHAQWLLFLETEGTSPQRLAEARLLAMAKMREPRTPWRFEIKAAPDEVARA